MPNMAVSRGSLTRRLSAMRSRARCWRGGNVIDLSPSGVHGASDINNVGQVVANHWIWQDLNGNGLAEPGEAADLNTRLDPVTGAGWTLANGSYAINDSGQITGRAFINGVAHAVLLTPQ